MDYSNNQETRKYKYYLVCVVVALLFIVGWFAWKWQVNRDASNNLALNSSSDYIIPGVPSINIFNHQGDLSYIFPSDTTAGAVSVLEYWNPGANNFVEISSFIYAEKEKTGEAIRKLIDAQYKNKYTFKREKLSINDLKKYINPKVKTPLLLFFPLDKDQAVNINFHPLSVLIGIKESEKKIVFHNYYFGNNYEMSFADFEKSWERMRPDERNAFYVIQPVDIDERLKEISSRKMAEYPDRIRVMKEFNSLVANFAISRVMSSTNQNYLAMEYILRVKSDPRFEKEVHNAYKTELYFILANAYLKKGELDSAKENALRSVELNHDLNKPLWDWPGMEIQGNKSGNTGEYSDPYRILGDVYLQTNEFELARQNYEKALAIRPDNAAALSGIDIANAKLSTNK